MTTITPAATLSVKDSSLSSNPNPVPFAGQAIECEDGSAIQEAVLAAASSAIALTFPVGLATAKILAISADDIADLVVTNDGTDMDVPEGQPFLLYNVAAADIRVSSVLGGKFTYVVGG